MLPQSVKAKVTTVHPILASVLSSYTGFHMINSVLLVHICPDYIQDITLETCLATAHHSLFLSGIRLMHCRAEWFLAKVGFQVTL